MDLFTGIFGKVGQNIIPAPEHGDNAYWWIFEGVRFIETFDYEELNLTTA